MALQRQDEPISWSEAAQRWQHDEAFQDTFTAALAHCPFEAFFFETPAVSAASQERPFEWVLVESAQLAGVPLEAGAFREHIGAGKGVRTFPNLGGDAELVVPCLESAPASYAHLATFVRGAERRQVHALWSAVGRAVERHLARSPAPIWVSTSGLGVYWVHVRVDQYPKYYTHAPYRVASGGGPSLMRE